MKRGVAVGCGAQGDLPLVVRTPGTVQTGDVIGGLCPRSPVLPRFQPPLLTRYARGVHTHVRTAASQTRKVAPWGAAFPTRGPTSLLSHRSPRRPAGPLLGALGGPSPVAVLELRGPCRPGRRVPREPKRRRCEPRCPRRPRLPALPCSRPHLVSGSVSLHPML